MDYSDTRYDSWGIAHHCARALAILFLAVGVPVSLLFLAPTLLKLTAGPLAPVLEKPAPKQGFSLTFLNAQGEVIGRQGPVIGLSLGLSEMPAHLPAAFLAAEDRRFFRHNGIDLLGMSRAAYANYQAGRVVAGGSGISQQTVKILTGDNERTFGRKLRELVNTAALERRYSKQQILEIYLNHIYLGEQAHGVDAATRSYFGVSARAATLAQAAMLAGLTRAPSLFSPRRNLAMARERAARVLDAMVETGAITPAAAAEAKAHPAELGPQRRDDHDYVLDAAALEARKLLTDNGFESGAFLVHTAIRSELQKRAETIIANAVREQGRTFGFSQGALAVMTMDGGIAAMVGGVDYGKSVFNRVTQARRQPGSAFKPFVYTAALERGISPWDWRSGGPVNISGYQPINYHNASYGQLQLIDALARSVNTVSVTLGQEVGAGTVAATARRLGITSTLHAYPSLALGTEVVTPLELTAAYAAFARGSRVEPWLVARLDNALDGTTAWRRERPDIRGVISDSVRRDMTAMLYQVVQRGTGTGARLDDREAAGKTGTSQDYRDAWFIGFTATHVAGVWIGNDDNSPMRGVTGGKVPAGLWRQAMRAAEAGTKPQKLDRTEFAPMEFFGVPYNEDYEYASPYPVQDVAVDSVRYADLRGTPRSWREEPPSSSYPPPPVSGQMMSSGPPSYGRPSPPPGPPPSMPAMTYQDYLDRAPPPAQPGPADYRYEQAGPYQSYR